jgi:uncharacterized RDD family membrane protein YckC
VGAAAPVEPRAAAAPRRVARRARGWLTPDRHDPTQVVVRRTVAYVVDALLIAGILLVVIWITGDVQRSPTGCPDPIPKGKSCLDYGKQALIVNNRAFIWFAVSLVTLFVLVFVVTQGITGASPGKSVLGIKVVRADGSRPGWKRSLLRAVCWGVDGLLLLLPAGLWLALLTPRHRRVGDYAAQTYVVRRGAAGRPVPRHRQLRSTDPSPDLVAAGE